MLLFNITCLHAQLCQGSLGDPVVDITFGAGPNPGPPLSAGTTNLMYLNTDCPNDGYYAIRNETSSCFFFTWQDVQQDHTGDPNGYFMLVNAKKVYSGDDLKKIIYPSPTVSLPPVDKPDN